MAKRISKQDATGDFPNALDELKAKFGSLDTAIHASDELIKMFKSDLGKLRKEIAGIDMGSVKGIKEFNSKQKEAQKTMLDTAKLEQQNIKLLQEKEKLKQQELRTQKLLNSESKKTLTAYQQESRALTEMRNRYKDLAVQKLNGIKLTKDEEKEYRRLIPQIKQTDAALKKIDARAGQFQRNVGNYPKVLNGFKNALGQLGLAFGAFQLAAGFSKTLVNFEEQAANMAKTLGVTVEEAKNLSRELANIDTRTSITDLQTIAAIGGQLGIEASQVVAFTESIDKLNVALGDEFTGGAEEITSVLGGMRNVLTDIKTDNAADDLLKLGNALNYIGAKGSATSPVIADFASRISGVGIPLGLTSDEVIGLSATLQELSVNAERGGTAVGAILQRITRDTKGFAELAGMPVKDFEELLNKDLLGAFKAVTKGFSTLKGDAVTQSKVLEKLGLTGSGASEVFLKLGGSIGLLEERVTQAGESLKSTESITDEFNVKNNTLGATMDKLTKDFQKYVIGVDDSGKVTGALSGTLQFLHDNFDQIASILEKTVRGFIAFKTAMMTLKLRDQFNDWRKMGTGIKDVGNNLNDAGKSAKSFGNAISSIGFAVIIEMLYEVASAWISVSNGAQLAAERTKLFNDAVAIGNEVATGWLDKRIKAEKKLLQAIDTRVSKGEITEKEAIKLRQNVINQTEEIVKKERLRLTGIKAMTSIQLGLAKAERDRLKKGMNAGFLGNTISEVKAYKDAEDAVSRLIATEKNRSEEIRVLNVFLEGVTDTQHDLNIETNKLNISTGKETKEVKEKTKAYKDANDQIERMISLQKETQDLTDEIALFEAEADIQAAIESQLESIALSGEYSLDIINARIQAEYDLRKAIIERQYQEIKTQSEADYASGADQGDSGAISRAIQKEKDARMKRDFELGKLDKEFIDKRKDVDKQIEESQEARLKSLNSSTEDAAKKNYDNERKWIELTTKFFEDQIDKRIALLDKESEAHKQQYDYFQGLAESGNINAQQSLAEEARLQREAEKEKAKLEQRKLYLQAFSAFMTNYTNRLEKGENSTQALSGASADEAVLEAILATLPAFYEGTESTGKTSNPLDVNGGRLSILHDDERVLPKALNDQVTGMSNADLVKYAQMGRISESVESGNNGWKDIALMTELNGLRKDFKTLTKVVKDKPETVYSIEQTISGVLALVKTEKRGNTTIRTENQYRMP